MQQSRRMQADMPCPHQQIWRRRRIRQRQLRCLDLAKETTVLCSAAQCTVLISFSKRGAAGSTEETEERDVIMTWSGCALETRRVPEWVCRENDAYRWKGSLVTW
jgi:hypothetical protein